MKLKLCGIFLFTAASAMAFIFSKPEKPEIFRPEIEEVSASVLMIGEDAPDVVLSSLDGETVRLAEHEGKNVVVLDFWASWCGPCRRALPKVGQVAAEFADANVAFYAVNMREDAATAKAALEELKVFLPAAMDLDGSLGEAFSVEGIPHTVIIDLDGKVWGVHTGFSPGMESLLSAELEMVLAGTPPPTGAVKHDAPDVYKAKPLPSGDEATLWIDFEKPYAAVLERELLRALEECPAAGSVPKEELAKFISEFVSFQCGQMTAKNRSVDYKPNPAPYKKLGKRLEGWFAAGADHPSLRYADVLVNRALWRKEKRLASAERGLALCDAAGLDAPWLRAELLEEMARFAEPAKDRKKWRAKAKKALVQALSADLYETGEERVMSFRLTSKLGPFFGKKEWRSVADLLAADEKVPGFIQQLADGYAHAEEAWVARGTGWGSKVAEDGWMGFGEHLDEARASLVAVWEAHPELPEAPTKMVMVSMGKSVEPNEERMWFDRAVAAQFDYAGAYSQLAWALTPRWGGSIAALQSIGDEWLATGRYDTKVPMQYFICAKYIMMDSGLTPVNFQRPEEQQKLMKMIRRYQADGTFDESSMQAAVSFVAAAAVLGGNHAMAYELLESIDYKTSDHFNTSRMGVNSWKDFKVSAVLQGGPVAEDYEVMCRLRDTGKFAEAEAACARLLEHPSLTALARERLQIERASLELGQAGADEWATIFKQGDKVPWAGGDGQYWKLDDRGRLQANAADMGLGWIPGGVSMVDGFELEFTLDRIGKNKAPNERSVLFFCRPEWHQYLPVNVRFMFKDQKVMVDRGYNDEEKKNDFSLLDGNQVRIVVKNRTMSIWVNGEAAFREYPMGASELCAEPLWIGIGDYYSGRFRAKYRYSNIRLKRFAPTGE
ncbi:TlpA family protein disulfide reductase [Pontiella sulfatireligans]|uniref:Thiol-disulfide oxidoreductase ResA n=1 Tax=Pontiella sulfatireligans TaxID=2750658 RepID=A0A6C2UJ48_9BACT|nr:TlpA disulfide reductase family protein [Pontiella sulfatireligans]VGO20245.1 Thiol-disulfide oxidoreductase ResA [Pontiella sulfatireligans]